MQPTSPHASFALTDRSAFVNKVFAFFGVALLVSGVGAYGGYLAFMSNPALLTNPWIMFGSFAVMLILAFTTHLWQESAPMNYLLFVLYALLAGFITTPLLMLVGATAGIGLIFKALIASTCVFVAAAVFGAVTQKDISSWGGMLMIGIIGVLIMGLINMFLGSNLLDMLLSGAAILIFTGFTAYDMQLIKQHYPDTMAVGAAMGLFINFLGLFRNILYLLWEFNRS